MAPVRIREKPRRARQVRLEVAQRPDKLVLQRVGVEVREGRMAPSVRTDRGTGCVELIELGPGRNRLVIGPPGVPSHVRRADENLWLRACVTTESVNSVTKPVVGGEQVAAPRKRRRWIAVKVEEIVRRQRAETQDAEQTLLTLESLRMHVQTLLSGPLFAGDPVVVEDDVRAPRKSLPLPRRRDRAHPEPECCIRCDAHEHHRSPRAPSRDAKPARRTPDDASSPVRVKERAQLHLRQQGGVGPRQLHRRGAACMTKADGSRRVAEDFGRTPSEVDTRPTQADCQRLGLSGSAGQRLLRLFEKRLGTRHPDDQTSKRPDEGTGFKVRGRRSLEPARQRTTWRSCDGVKDCTPGPRFCGSNVPASDFQATMWRIAGVERSYLAPPATPPAQRGPAPSFSVLIAAYEVGDVIGEALESVRQQTLPPLEVIVCDDGSTDDLDAAVAPFRDEITFLRKSHGGEASAKNMAAAAARGDFIVVLDGDDVYLPTRLEALAELAQVRPDLDILTTDAYLVAGHQRIRRNYDRRWPFEATDQRRAILQRNFIFGHAAVRRERFLEHGGFDESILWTTDWDLWLRLILDGSLAGAVAEPLALYRLRETSLTARRRELLLGKIATLEKAARNPRLAVGEHAVVAKALSWHRRELDLADARAALAQGLSVGRRRPFKLLLTRHVRIRTRLEAAAMVAAPARYGRFLRRRDAASWVGAGGTRIRRAPTT